MRLEQQRKEDEDVKPKAKEKGREEGYEAGAMDKGEGRWRGKRKREMMKKKEEGGETRTREW